MRFLFSLLAIIYMWSGILPGHPNLDWRTIRFLNQNLWLVNPSERQWRSAEILKWLVATLVPTPNLEDQETAFV